MKFGLLGASSRKRPWDPNAAYVPYSPRPQVLYDFDMDSDVDDVVDAVVLLNLEHAGEIDIIGAVATSANAKAAPCWLAIANYYNRSSIPTGVNTSAPGNSTSSYTATVTTNYGVPGFTDASNFPNYITTLRTVLAGAANHSVTWVTTGDLSSVVGLLASSADGISSLTGTQLVSLKVKDIFVNAGNWPSGAGVSDFAIGGGTTSASFLSNWPHSVPVIFNPINNIGTIVTTGSTMLGLSTSNPARAGWVAFIGTSPASTEPGWSQTSFLVIARGLSPYQTYGARHGTAIINGDTSTTFDTNTDSNHGYLTKVMSDADFITAITNLTLDKTGPVFTSGSSTSVIDGVQLSLSLTTSLPAAFSIVGGADQAKFEISGSTLRWAGNGTQAFASPQDANGDNIYLVTVRARDAGGWTTDQSISVTVASAFTPANFGSNLKLWLEADDLTTLFQTITGTTAVAADGDVVGTWKDKGSGTFDMTAFANDTTRPVWKTSGGLKWVQFDGTNDILRRAANIWGSGLPSTCSVFIAMRGNPGSATNISLFSTSDSTPGNASARYITNDNATTSTASALIRNSASTFQVAVGNLREPNAFDNTDRVYGITDDGSTLRTYTNGVAGATFGYTRSGTYTTLNHTTLGGYARAGAESWFACRSYAVVVVDKVLSSTERANLVTYLGNKAGLTL